MNICCCRTFIRHFLISPVCTSSSLYVNEIIEKLMKKLACVRESYSTVCKYLIFISKQQMQHSNHRDLFWRYRTSIMDCVAVPSLRAVYTVFIVLVVLLSGSPMRSPPYSC